MIEFLESVGPYITSTKQLEGYNLLLYMQILLGYLATLAQPEGAILEVSWEL